MYRNQVATSSGFGWRIAAELGGDIKRNTHLTKQLELLNPFELNTIMQIKLKKITRLR